ncbi:hypothetical protein ABI_15290 [Asticcacaulis biprosthecium C19]|uniref:Uncharacterized protein n=1 Tax=Asticcacaulis biprosthecium C19 TaxID=715226 RepID=F4QJA6_9CAUL|nr:hypothetical protein [Asticcacaulis biprosthecium]EGF93089.1 hypothetical protein ABI_15290 [Asticcacaulis biprosthecium C19]
MHVQPKPEAMEGTESLASKVIPPRFVTIRQLPGHVMVTSRCTDCGTESQYSVTQLLREKVGAMSVDDLAAKWRCRRESCHGPLEMDVDEAD